MVSKEARPFHNFVIAWKMRNAFILSFFLIKHSLRACERLPLAFWGINKHNAALIRCSINEGLKTNLHAILKWLYCLWSSYSDRSETTIEVRWGSLFSVNTKSFVFLLVFFGFISTTVAINGVFRKPFFMHNWFQTNPCSCSQCKTFLFLCIWECFWKDSTDAEYVKQ